MTLRRDVQLDRSVLGQRSHKCAMLGNWREYALELSAAAAVLVLPFERGYSLCQACSNDPRKRSLS